MHFIHMIQINNFLSKFIPIVSVVSIILIVLYSFSYKAEQVSTPANLSFTFTTTNNGGTYAPNNVLAVWITKTNGDFVKTLIVRGGIRKPKLITWIAQTSGNTIDAVTGPTLTSFGSHTVTWNGTNSAKNIVPDGDYVLHIENVSANQQGPYASFEFVKGNEQYSNTFEDKTYFKNISLQYTPTQVSIERVEKQDANLSISPSRGCVLFQFSNEEFDDVQLTILSIQGTVVYTVHNPYYLNAMNTIEWHGVDINGHKVPTGTYICKLCIGNKRYTQKFFYSKL